MAVLDIHAVMFYGNLNLYLKVDMNIGVCYIFGQMYVCLRNQIKMSNIEKVVFTYYQERTEGSQRQVVN